MDKSNYETTTFRKVSEQSAFVGLKRQRSGLESSDIYRLVYLQIKSKHEQSMAVSREKKNIPNR
jgi:hypothetical protein